MTLEARVLALIERLAHGERDDDARDALLVEALALQSETVAPYARLVKARKRTRGTTPASFPALPTDVFRFARVASHGPERDVALFRTSGTTHGTRGEHALASLRLYDAAARAWGAFAFLPDGVALRFVIVAPDPRRVPDSSLGYMLGRYVEWFGTSDAVWALGDDAVDVDAVARALDDARAPVALCGTSFGLVHLDEALGARRFALPEGSRIMQTGGFKGRSRELDGAEMRAMLASRYGVAPARIVAEYGMTELSSQLWESTLRDERGARRLLVPGWMRATPVDADTLAPVPHGELGVLRLDDLANLGSVCAIQTADLAREVDDGIELFGRTPGAVPRGCSLATEEALA